jgi:hypothetical protein
MAKDSGRLVVDDRVSELLPAGLGGPGPLWLLSGPWVARPSRTGSKEGRGSRPEPLQLLRARVGRMRKFGSPLALRARTHARLRVQTVGRPLPPRPCRHIIDMLTMHPEERRKVARILGEIEAGSE